MTYTAYKKYKTVTEWWENEGSGKFPLQLPMAISKLQKEEGLTFHEAFEKLINNNATILVDDINN